MPVLAQWARSKHFRLYDYGSEAENRAHYGTAEPTDIAAAYGRLDIPVDFMAGACTCSDRRLWFPLRHALPFWFPGAYPHRAGRVARSPLR
jgi:hypothetical protein